MSAFDPILVPLDGSVIAAQSLECAGWLAGELRARLHVLGAGHPVLPPKEALERLRVPERLWQDVLLHQSESIPEQAVLDLAHRCEAGLIVMSARGRSAEKGEHEPLLGHVTVSVIEGTDVPVLVLPPGYRESLPWTKAVVPISGESPADEALAVAVRLACELDLELTVVHVVGTEGGLAAQTRYADALHHEYANRLGELVERALSDCDRRDARRITDVVLRRGDVATALLETIEEREASLVVVGWHARFAPGRALILKTLLERLSCPALLVKAPPRPPFRLAVGDALK